LGRLQRKDGGKKEAEAKHTNITHIHTRFTKNEKEMRSKKKKEGTAPSVGVGGDSIRDATATRSQRLDIQSSVHQSGANVTYKKNNKKQMRKKKLTKTNDEKKNRQNRRRKQHKHTESLPVSQLPLMTGHFSWVMEVE
jgi:hypothetical protein